MLCFCSLYSVLLTFICMHQCHGKAQLSSVLFFCFRPVPVSLMCSIDVTVKGVGTNIKPE